MKKKLKFGTGSMTIAVIMGVFSGIAGIFILAARDLIGEQLPAEYEQLLVDGLFVTLAIMLIIMAALLVFAGIKSKYSKGWNIFLIVFAVFGLLGITTADATTIVTTLILNGLLLAFSILNVKDYNEQTTSNQNTTYSGSQTLENRLNEISDLRDRGLISDEEYENLRDQAIKNL